MSKRWQNLLCEKGITFGMLKKLEPLQDAIRQECKNGVQPILWRLFGGGIARVFSRNCKIILKKKSIGGGLKMSLTPILHIRLNYLTRGRFGSKSARVAGSGFFGNQSSLLIISWRPPTSPCGGSDSAFPPKGHLLGAAPALEPDQSFCKHRIRGRQLVSAEERR